MTTTSLGPGRDAVASNASASNRSAEHVQQRQLQACATHSASALQMCPSLVPTKSLSPSSSPTSCRSPQAPARATSHCTQAVRRWAPFRIAQSATARSAAPRHACCLLNLLQAVPPRAPLYGPSCGRATRSRRWAPARTAQSATAPAAAPRQTWCRPRPQPAPAPAW